MHGAMQMASEYGVKPTPISIDHEAAAIAMAKSNPSLLAELSDEPPAWYLIRVNSGEENIAAAHLAARCFGIYLPTVRTLERSGNGQRREVRRVLFPRYVFVFVWGLNRHLRRIEACPGVVGVERVGSCRVVVPDSVIDTVQLIETRLEGFKGSRKRKGWRRQVISELEDEKIVITTKSRFIDVPGLDETAFSVLWSELLAPLDNRAGRGRRLELAR